MSKSIILLIDICRILVYRQTISLYFILVNRKNSKIYAIDSVRIFCSLIRLKKYKQKGPVELLTLG